MKAGLNYMNITFRVNYLIILARIYVLITICRYSRINITSRYRYLHCLCTYKLYVRTSSKVTYTETPLPKKRDNAQI